MLASILNTDLLELVIGQYLAPLLLAVLAVLRECS